MKATLYSTMNQDAKAWWHFRELRKQGHTKEARFKERESMLHSITAVKAAKKNGGYFLHGVGGWALYYDNGCSLSGYGDGQPYWSLCRFLGVPRVDLRVLTFNQAFE